ncbi:MULTISPECIES: hypothetical protein [unclassified Streptomyces]|uniref:hypothetical protein n=1 Tax=unclassified Streptomyces TaxID=2593676 RepID=UPI0008913CCA|nr:MULTISPECIES: hypothetical protein [unclassified Streptomyces]PBC83280.1 hypothetical protein BX261_3212 [Streptomyces sp. 2321.6]SDR43725.1 hypothetical protein SAMN05216511_3989 [Streptomyces sp. KS_16]SEC90940.1 hypothetical protein SAMN05428940_3214 [Streptomyces sp. 2133.1]SEE81881.1 hypothetical protein SAMN05428954_4017 [Streptomyces sp. 2112.3]SNC69358.1 hypothetical protein SAMN06272741_3206 [Streptomyces sp. 2114.4]
MSNPHDPIPAHDTYQPYGHNGGAYGRNQDGTGANRAALIIHTLADIAAGFLGLWILLYLLEANQGNVFVGFVHGMADFLAGWSQDIFTMKLEGLRVFLNYGLPAVIYLLLGHGIAARVRRL